MKHNVYSIITRYTVDSFYYHNWALTISQGNWLGHEVFFLGPFYAYFLAIIYKIFGSNIIAVQIIQTLLSSFGVILLYLITKRISNARNAVIAAIIYIFSGILIFYTGALLYVEVNIFFSLCLAYLLIRLTDQYSLRLLIISAIILGLLVIIRPEFLLLLFLLIPYFIIKIKPKPMRQYIIFALITLAVVSVIPIRNYLVAKDFVLFTGHSGVNFFYGNNPQTDGTWRQVYRLQRSDNVSIQSFQRSSQTINGRLAKASVASNYWFDQGLNFITHHPGQYLKLLYRKFLLFINSYEIPSNYYFYQTRDDSFILKLAIFSFGFILPCAILGIILSAKQWKDLYLLYAIIFIYLISSLIFYVISRLRTPVIPFLIIFASCFIGDFYQRLKNKKYNTVLLLGFGFLVLFGLTQIRVINKKEFDAGGYFQKGQIYLDAHKYSLAVSDYNKALTINQLDIPARYGLLHAFLGLNNQVDAQKHIAILMEIAKKYPYPLCQFYAHMANADYAVANNNIATAASELKQSIAINPYDASAHYELSALYMKLDKYEEAMIEMQKTLELDPEYENAQRMIYSIKKYIQPK
jgi:4-amino-4-deoxy-L-arabinose transferase-like glycosyltransferase